MTPTTEREIALSPADQRLPLLQLLLVGFQHVLLMYGGAVAVPLIVRHAEDEVGTLVVG